MSKDLGLVQAIKVGASAPSNLQMIWYDTATNLHKYYDTATTTWVSFASAAASLAAVLSAGAVTSGSDITLTALDVIKWSNSGFTAEIDVVTLSADRVLQLPNKSGTIAVLSDLTALTGLANTLASASVTGGTDITTSVGDVVKSAVGTNVLDLDFSGGGTKVSLTAGNTGIVIEHAANLKATAATGRFILETAAAGSVGYQVTRSGVVIAGFEIDASSNVVIKGSVVDGTIDFITTITGPTTATQMKVVKGGAILPAGKKLTVGAAALPTLTGDLLLVGDGSAEAYSVVRKASGSTGGFRLYYSATDKVFEVEGDVSNNTIFKGLGVGKTLTLSVTDARSTLRNSLIIDGANLGAVRIERHLRVKRFEQTGALTSFQIPAEGVSLFEMNYGSAQDVKEILGASNDMVLFLINTGAGTLTFKHNDVVSAFKIFTPTAADYDVDQYQGITLVYSATLTGWLILSNK